jgi:Lrp/AsnC family transcriptional regulator, regulator for asnA, asnC and gidA
MNMTFDEIDEKIIALFQANGRQSNRAVGRELGLSESAIRKRIKRLTEAEAISYGLVVDEKAAGLGVSGWLSVEARPALARPIAEYVGGMQRCVLCFMTTGPFNIRAFIYATDIAELRAIIERLEQFKGASQVEFRAAVEVSQNRSDLIMFSHRATRSRWPI